MADTNPLPPALAVADTGTQLAELDVLAGRAAHYAARARGPGTLRAYRSAWSGYEAWCRALGRNPLDGNPDTVALYVVRRADDGLAVSTIRVAVAAIRTAHLLAGMPLDLRQPRFLMTLESIVRSRGTRPRRQAAPAVPTVIRRMPKQRASSVPAAPWHRVDPARAAIAPGSCLRFKAAGPGGPPPLPSLADHASPHGQ